MPATSRPLTLLLNLAHAIDHLFLLIFATAVAAIAADFGFARWEDLMPYGAGAFVMFGLGSALAGRLGDLWGRRQMMLVFYFGMGASALLTACTRQPWQLAVALTVLGCFSAIYHPVGIPMLLQHASRPGRTIGLSGLSGNLGIAAAAMVTGLLVQHAGWRAAFAVPGLGALVLGAVFARVAPHETEPPAQRTRKAGPAVPARLLARVFMVMTAAAVASGILFNFTTNGNGQLMAERLRGLVEVPSTLGALLAAIYAMASLSQLMVGRLIDRVALKPLFLVILLAQVPLLVFAAYAQGWWIFAALLGTMALIFGAIPFTDAITVRFVDDRMRSRVAGMRLTVAFGISSAAVWLLGPLVKANGFTTMMLAMAAISLLTAATMLWLPDEDALQREAAPA